MKKIYVITAALIVAISVVLGMTAQTVSNDLFEANVEALAQMELPSSIIVCDTGFCGYCWEVKRFGLLYKCVWTGMQDDYCDCSYIGYV